MHAARAGPRRRRVALAATLGMALLHAAAPCVASEEADQGRGGEVQGEVATPAMPPTPRVRAQARFAEAEQAAAQFRFAEALGGYREALAIDASAPFARLARSRVAFLEAHAEGDFGPLSHLEALRRDPGRLGDAAAAEGFGREVAGFPPGQVRVEARLLLADALEHRLGRADQALEVLEAVLDDPATDALKRALTLGRVVEIHRSRGDLEAARAAVKQHPGVAPALEAEVVRVARRETLRWVAGAVLGLVALAALGALAKAKAATREAALREAATPLLVGAALYVGGAGAILAKVHGGADPRPFVWLGVGVLGVALAGRALRVALPELGSAGRTSWSLCCALGVLAAAYLALERADAGYLLSFGL
ncbi:hypothetical protein [Chondromyces apiculatus]|uniref:Tetratricopeptide repeat protein n=1 Tax=Chondromyces apiculatus DSM 436 TaxID=1192034 RepID=A0A017SUX9_9BACT|nr:hypothetical protein [Chondromyces apiculatus]EYF00076.1 Hypothetical protein CAP_1398 [Chondromyces apiculatus DSM 436]